MEKETSVSAARIQEIDGLRGIAILLVVSFHYVNNQLVLSESFAGKLLCKITSFGWVGVDLFFVLSGFLIGTILIRYKGNPHYFKTFYIRRFVRILPNYFLFLLVALVIGSLPFFADNYMLSGNQTVPMWSYFAFVHNFYMASLQNMGNDVLSITWSIGVEEQFYLFFPLFVYFLRLYLLPYFLAMIIVIAVVLRMQYDHWIPGYVLLTSRMDALAMGIWVAYLKETSWLQSLTRTRLNILVACMLLDIVLCGGLYAVYGDLGAFKHTLFALFFSGCVILALVKAPYYSAVLRNHVLIWVGTISYSLYLFHYFILALFHHFIGNKAGVILANTTDLVITILALLTSFAVAWLVYKLLETPMVRLGKRITSY
jgi:peptidoglycan/LPS O-acetylase OafA/YrhL